MRQWLLTNTTYGTWLPGSVRGSVTSVRDHPTEDDPRHVRIVHNIPGKPYEDAIPSLEAAAREQMIGPPIFFTHDHAESVCRQFRETSTYRGWTLHAVAIMYNHFHLVVTVPGTPDPKKILADFKAYGTRSLNKKFGRVQSETWWTTNGSKRLLRGDAALAAAIEYVLKKQPNPLVLWYPGMDDVTVEG